MRKLMKKLLGNAYDSLYDLDSKTAISFQTEMKKIEDEAKTWGLEIKLDHKSQKFKCYEENK